MWRKLPPQPPLHTPAGRAYGARVLARARDAFDPRLSRLERPYGPDYWQKVDAYVPDRDDGPWPIIVFAHGGSWIAGYKEWMAFMAPAMTAIPAVFVSASYRLAPTHKFPVPFEDCLKAIAWVYDYAQELGGDRSRLFVGGHSAGGHLMALAALRRDRLAALGLPEGVVNACLAVSAPFDLRLPDPSIRPEAVMFAPLLADWSDADSASPISYISPAAPPFLICVGEHDFPFLRIQGERMRRQLEDAGVSTKYLDLPDHDHFDTSERCIEPGHPWLAEVTRMINSA